MFNCPITRSKHWWQLMTWIRCCLQTIGKAAAKKEKLSSNSLQPYDEVFGLQRFRECELIHGRWAMLATLGVLIGEKSVKLNLKRPVQQRCSGGVLGEEICLACDCNTFVSGWPAVGHLERGASYAASAPLRGLTDGRPCMDETQQRSSRQPQAIHRGLGVFIVDAIGSDSICKKLHRRQDKRASHCRLSGAFSCFLAPVVGPGYGGRGVNLLCTWLGG